MGGIESLDDSIILGLSSPSAPPQHVIRARPLAGDFAGVWQICRHTLHFPLCDHHYVITISDEGRTLFDKPALEESLGTLESSFGKGTIAR